MTPNNTRQREYCRRDAMAYGEGHLQSSEYDVGIEYRQFQLRSVGSAS